MKHQRRRDQARRYAIDHERSGAEVPVGIDEAMSLALQHQLAGRLPEAVDIYHRVLRAQSDHPDALHLLGVIALQVGESDRAVDLIARAIEASPHVADFHNSLGTALTAQGQLGEAAASFERALAIKPDHAEALKNLGVALARSDSAATYQQGVLELRRSPYIDWPAHVHIETMAVCNAACTFCPYAALERQGERMPDALIAKIINDLTGIPRMLEFQLSPFKVNDPFIDSRLFDILGEVNAKLPNARITLTTNGAPLTEDKLDRLAQVKNVGYLWVSVNDHRPDEYEATMKLPFARTLARLDMIYRRKAEGHLPFRVVLSRVGDGSTADAEFREWVRARYPACEVAVLPRGDWLGQVDMPVAEVPDLGCSRWFELSITTTGVVALCCMDGQARFPIGDARTQHLLDVYNAPAYRKFREGAVSRLDVSPCHRCTFL